MSEPTAVRPPQVTMAAWTIVVGSVVVVLTGFDTMSSLHTLEMRTAIEKFLAEPPGSNLGLDVSAVTSLIHVATLVASGCAAAAAILGFEALRRNRLARVLLTVVAVPLFAAGLASGTFFSSLVAAAAGMLWLSPAREWFAGTWKPPVASARQGRSAPTWPPPPPEAPGPPPPGHGAAPGISPPPRPVVGYGAHPAVWLPPPPVSRPLPLRRPPALAVACILAWVFAGLTVLIMLATMALLAVDRSLLLTEVHKQNPDLAQTGVSDDLLVSASYVVGGAIVLWCVAALVFAGFAFAGHAWARIGLLVSSGAAVIALLLSVVTGQVVLLIPLSAAAASSAALMRPDVRAWFARHPRRRGGMAA